MVVSSVEVFSAAVTEIVSTPEVVKPPPVTAAAPLDEIRRVSAPAPPVMVSPELSVGSEPPRMPVTVSLLEVPGTLSVPVVSGQVLSSVSG